MIGIYKITNTINNKVYIGQSRDIEYRWKKHKQTAFQKDNKCYNYPLYRAMRKYGINNFTFEVLKKCLISELNKYEKYWIKYYNSVSTGYNQTEEGYQNITYNKLSIQDIQKIILLLKTSNLSFEEIANKYDISIRTIYAINAGESWIQQNIKYPIRSKIPVNCCINCGIAITKNATRCRNCNNKLQSKAIRPNRAQLKQLIRKNSFEGLGRQFGVSGNAIRKWCIQESLPSKSHDIKNISDKEWELI